MSNTSLLSELDSEGFYISKQLYQPSEVKSIIRVINSTNVNSESIKQTESLYSIRNVLNNIPSLEKELFNQNFKDLVLSFGAGYQIIKSIYFDKPPLSNWFVPNHQDLTLNVADKAEHNGFVNWVKKEDFYSVQPPIEFLENIITVRVHLDDTDENNGALIVSPMSHRNGIVRLENHQSSNGTICKVNKGAAMLMKPLLFHKSLKTINDKRRRVIHLELSNKKLPLGMNWKEEF